MKKIKKFMAVFTAAFVTASVFSGCSISAENNSINEKTENEKIYYENEIQIVLSDDGITADGNLLTDDGKVYISDDIIYYEDKDSYESGNPYGEGTDADKHRAEEAAAAKVVNITEAGTYRLSGRLSNGQIRIDLGEDAFDDENAVVTLVLDGVDINCDVAPAVLFMNVYECDSSWSAETAASNVDTSNAGAKVIIADGSTNNIAGSYVAKIYKDKEGEKKLWKQDGAFYSYMSMNIDGETEQTGVMNLTAENEGIDSELHLTINGGNINIYSQNDGINTNEDGVSVTTINGGNIRIIAGLGEEGDGVDSNGWLVINGGTVVAAANPGADAGLDSDMGSYINGGTVVALGSTMDWAESDSRQVTMNLQFAQYKESDSAIIVTQEDGSVVFAYDPSEDEVIGSNIRNFKGAVISSPAFAQGENYNVYTGGEITGDETAGMYDISSVTGFDNAVKQGHTGSDIMMHPGGFGAKGEFGGQPPRMPEEMRPPEIPEENSFDPEKMKPDFKEIPEWKADVNENGQLMQIPEKGTPPWHGENGVSKDITEPLPTFYMQDKVNSFSGVTDLNV
ncbi:MAG: carbohydrate-binding domain-containing protein [Oscillospiraceae bacterium]|nr:carbohydrate-binding domain-containing protein [Oscillospiraceae bacterium]